MSTPVLERPVAVLARVEVGLADRGGADPAVYVDQEPDLEAVADGEGERLEQRAARRHLAGQRLLEPRELGIEAA